MKLPTLLHNLQGKYKGNVTGTTLNVGLLKKTGKLQCRIKDDRFEITSSSLYTKELSVKVPIDDKLMDFFSEKVMIETVGGVEEKRVAFIQSVDVDYGFFFNKWLKGMAQIHYAYQLKFVNELLIAIRIQSYSTSDVSKLLYFLEMINLEKTDDLQPPNVSTKPKIPAMKSDWEFGKTNHE